MKPGDLVPDFTLPDQHGAPRTLSTMLEDGPIVLFFYPAAMTTGCTAESCHFRDLAAETFGVKRRFGPLPLKRHTFVIGTDSRVLEVVKSEFGMNTHADKALVALRENAKA